MITVKLSDKRARLVVDALEAAYQVEGLGFSEDERSDLAELMSDIDIQLVDEDSLDFDDEDYHLGY